MAMTLTLEKRFKIIRKTMNTYKAYLAGLVLMRKLENIKLNNPDNWIFFQPEGKGVRNV